LHLIDDDDDGGGGDDDGGTLFSLFFGSMPQSQLASVFELHASQSMPGPSLLVRAPILSEIFGVQRGPA